MNVAEALEYAQAFALPGFFMDDAAMTDERHKNEEAIKLLHEAWFSAPAGSEPFSYDLVRELADRNRDLCDRFGTERLRDEYPATLARALSDADLIAEVAALQSRPVSEVAAAVGNDMTNLTIVLADSPVKCTVLGFDIETTERDPSRGYLINFGLAIMDMQPKATPHDGHSASFGIPEMYADKGVPLADIHKIQWSDLEGKKPFRQDTQAQEALLRAFKHYPLMAHNAAFEDSWLMLQLNGYAEARKAGEIVLIDTRDIARRIDVDGRSIPREQGPYSLENWARRRGVLAPNEAERHLGLDDVVLMLWTVQAELELRNMFKKREI